MYHNLDKKYCPTNTEYNRLYYDSDLFKFMDSHKTESRSNVTHVSQHPKAKYEVPVYEKKTFYKHLSEFIEQNGFSPSIMETRYKDSTDGKYKGPVLIDFDILVNKNMKERPANTTTIFENAKLLQQIMRKYINFTVDELDLYVFIKKRCGTKNEDGEVVAKKDGIHFVFPNITIDYSSGFMDGIRDQWIAAYNEGKIMTEYRCLNTPEDIFDKNLCNPSTWLVYGCAKKDNFPYILRYALDSSGDEMDIETVYDSNSLVDLMDRFSIRHEDREITPYKIEPEWLKLKDIVIKVDETKSTDSDREEIDDETDLMNVKDVLSLIANKRWDNYDDWYRIGLALYNHSRDKEQDDKYFLLWDTFSKKSDKYQKDVCKRFWTRNFRDSGSENKLTLGTINYFAKTDNQEGYNAYLRERSKRSIKNDITPEIDYTEVDFAELLYDLYKDDFVCVIEDKIVLWYVFNNHRWIKNPRAKSLRSKIAYREKKGGSSEEDNSIRSYIKELIMEFTGDEIDESDKSEKNKHSKKLKAMKSIYTKLGTATFNNHIIEMATTLFDNDEFMEKADTNPFLMGFTNGVLDMSEKKIKFRPGKPDDYITKTTGYKYPVHKNYHWDHKEIKDAISYVSKILPNKDVLDYMLTVLGICLVGQELESLFIICTGIGSNGKSTLISNIVSKVFGEYFEKVQPSLLTQKRGAAQNASPELAKLKGVKIVSSDEPEHNDELFMGQIKQMTGGDEIAARHLHQNSFKYKPMLVLFLLCNAMPKIRDDQEGTWRRTHKVDFPTKFVPRSDNYKLRENEIFRDKGIDSKFFERMREPFVWIIVQKLQDYYDNDKILVIPDIIKKATKSYRSENDLMDSYLSSHYEFNYSEYQDMSIPISTIYNKYVAWLSTNHQSEKAIDKSELTHYMTMNYGNHYCKEGRTEKIIGIKKI